MEPEHHEMREGELSTMKVRSRWSSLSSPGFGLKGTARPGFGSHITRHATHMQEVFVECWRRRKGWGKFICLEQIGMDCTVFCHPG